MPGLRERHLRARLWRGTFVEDEQATTHRIGRGQKGLSYGGLVSKSQEAAQDRVSAEAKRWCVRKTGKYV